jgi:peroxiredoxin Q/BCP
VTHLRVGDLAPDFTVDGVDGLTREVRTYRRSEYEGSPLLLAFYPADNSPVCTRQMESYTANIELITGLGAQLVALSPQDPASHARFAAASGGFAFPLLSDVDKAVARSYGTLGLLELYRRCTFLLDAHGRVAWVHRSIGPGLVFRSAEELAGRIEALPR